MKSATCYSLGLIWHVRDTYSSNLVSMLSCRTQGTAALTQPLNIQKTRKGAKDDVFRFFAPIFDRISRPRRFDSSTVPAITLSAAPLSHVPMQCYCKLACTSASILPMHLSTSLSPPPPPQASLQARVQCSDIPFSASLHANALGEKDVRVSASRCVCTIREVVSRALPSHRVL